jgi:hypothetical protein
MSLTSCCRRGLLAALVALTIAVPAAASAHGTAPGAPGAPAFWTPADKDGFGTATSLTSKVWHTLEQGELTEVYYPDLGTRRSATCSSWSPTARRSRTASATPPSTMSSSSTSAA